MRRRVLLVLLAATALAGCAPQDPYAQHSGDRDPRKEARPQRLTPPADRELAGTIPTRRPARPAFTARSPEAALRRAAGLYGNWTSATAPARFRAIAAMSVGDARAQLRQVAAQARADTQQQRVVSRSQVISVVVHGRGRRRRGEVVTRDVVSGAGLPTGAPETHLTRAVTERQAGGWVIARWEPQP